MLLRERSPKREKVANKTVIHDMQKIITATHRLLKLILSIAGECWEGRKTCPSLGMLRKLTKFCMI